MPTSEARLIANRQNATRSTGPKTVEGKQRSRRNGLKHGMAGSGVVIPESDAVEVDRRKIALQQELAPKSALGSILVEQMATLSVRMERGAKQEFAAVSSRVRHAADAFDEARIDQAEQLFATLAQSPRTVLRQLMRTPEGVDCLLEAWDDLRTALTRPLCPKWVDVNLEQATRLLGFSGNALAGTRIDALAKASWGNLTALAEDERTGLDLEARKGWARERLIAWVDEQIAELEEHRETLDHASIEQDRAEAGDRALFDPSREASLARRYESEARRGFFRALSEFRKVEAEAANRAPEETCEPLASSREKPEPREPKPTPAPSRPGSSRFESPEPLETRHEKARRAVPVPG